MAQAQGLVNAGSVTGGTMYYALGENATTAPADNLYTTSIPTATNAGTYYVWYKAVGSGNYSDSEPAVITAIISKQGDLQAVVGNEGLWRTFDAITLTGVVGQEYVIVEAGTEISEASAPVSLAVRTKAELITYQEVELSAGEVKDMTRASVGTRTGKTQSPSTDSLSLPASTSTLLIRWRRHI